mmetsp:Transcript_27251/g.53102  ORF Transcript_27251/g.53102 Transcript_27251/m.53102 type:complete len:220 (+) Transcript_27251:776-1435(+)
MAQAAAVATRATTTTTCLAPSGAIARRLTAGVSRSSLATCTREARRRRKRATLRRRRRHGQSRRRLFSMKASLPSSARRAPNHFIPNRLSRSPSSPLQLELPVETCCLCLFSFFSYAYLRPLLKEDLTPPPSSTIRFVEVGSRTVKLRLFTPNFLQECTKSKHSHDSMMFTHTKQIRGAAFALEYLCAPWCTIACSVGTDAVQLTKQTCCCRSTPWAAS